MVVVVLFCSGRAAAYFIPEFPSWSVNDERVPCDFVARWGVGVGSCGVRVVGHIRGPTLRVSAFWFMCDFCFLVFLFLDPLIHEIDRTMHRPVFVPDDGVQSLPEGYF